MKYNFSRGYPIKNIDSESISNLRIYYSGKLNVFDWLRDVPQSVKKEELYEVRFKNTRKAYFYNTNKLRLNTGDIVAVESSPGHDIGIVSLTGQLVLHQLNKLKIPSSSEFKTIYRKAKPYDIEKWKEAIDLEDTTMIESRKISSDLKLNMKIGDVEYQGDKTKAIFYYIAEERVDFRQLIKVLADRFKIRVEMRQIGARQEAARIGGIGPCGRELCCSTWINRFVSVSTNSARYQELSLNPQKLAGQCSKLKCCLNYELSSYMDERKNFPSTEVTLNTNFGKATHIKTDVYRHIMWYVVHSEKGSNIIPLSVETVKDVIQKNKQGKPVEVVPIKSEPEIQTENLDYENVVGQDSLTRFDKPKKRNQQQRFKKKRRNPQRKRNDTNNK